MVKADDNDHHHDDDHDDNDHDDDGDDDDDSGQGCAVTHTIILILFPLTSKAKRIKQSVIMLTADNCLTHIG